MKPIPLERNKFGLVRTSVPKSAKGTILQFIEELKLEVAKQEYLLLELKNEN